MSCKGILQMEVISTVKTNQCHCKRLYTVRSNVVIPGRASTHVKGYPKHQLTTITTKVRQ